MKMEGNRQTARSPHVLIQFGSYKTKFVMHAPSPGVGVKQLSIAVYIGKETAIQKVSWT